MIRGGHESHECMKQFKVDFKIPPHNSKVKSQIILSKSSLFILMLSSRIVWTGHEPGPEHVYINHINQDVNIIIFI